MNTKSDSPGYSGPGLDEAGIKELRDHLSQKHKPGLTHAQALQAYATIVRLQRGINETRQKTESSDAHGCYIPDGWEDSNGIPPLRDCEGDGHYLCGRCAKRIKTGESDE